MKKYIISSLLFIAVKFICEILAHFGFSTTTGDIAIVSLYVYIFNKEQP